MIDSTSACCTAFLMDFREVSTPRCMYPVLPSDELVVIHARYCIPLERVSTHLIVQEDKESWYVSTFSVEADRNVTIRPTTPDSFSCSQAVSPLPQGASQSATRTRSAVGRGYTAVFICSYSDTVTGPQPHAVAMFLN